MYVKYIPSPFLSQLSPWYWGPYIKDFVWKTLIYLWAHFSVVWVTKAKYQIKLKRIKTLILAYKPVHFVLLIDSVITLSAKLLNSWPWMQTQQLSVGVITGFFEKQTSLPGSNKLSCSPFSSNLWVCWLTLLAYTFNINEILWQKFFRTLCSLFFGGLLLVSFQSIFSLLCPPTPPPKKNMKYKILFVFFLKEVTSIGKNDALLALSVTSSCQHYTSTHSLWTEPAKIRCC